MTASDQRAQALKVERGKLEPQETDRGVLLPVKIVPGASRSKVAGVLDGMLKVAVAAAPEKGQANKALIELLAAVLKVPQRSISIERGHTSPRKVVLLEGLTSQQVCRALEGD